LIEPDNALKEQALRLSGANRPAWVSKAHVRRLIAGLVAPESDFQAQQADSDG
jgi:hypothetical protein